MQARRALIRSSFKKTFSNSLQNLETFSDFKKELSPSRSHTLVSLLFGTAISRVMKRGRRRREQEKGRGGEKQVSSQEGKCPEKSPPLSFSSFLLRRRLSGAESEEEGKGNFVRRCRIGQTKKITVVNKIPLFLSGFFF